MTLYLLKAQICLLIYFGIDPLNSFLTVGIQGVAFRAAYVATLVKMVYSKSSVLKKVRLSVQAVHMEATGIIINTKKRSMRESGFKNLEGCLLITHASLNYFEACSESSKSGLYTTLPSMFRIIPIKVDCTKHPILDDLETCSLSFKVGSYK